MEMVLRKFICEWDVHEFGANLRCDNNLIFEVVGRKFLSMGVHLN